MLNDSDQISWLLTFASSIACILGSCVIYGDIVWSLILPKHAFLFQDNPSVLVASLAISSGVLLFTALYSLLPTALHYLQDQVKDGDEQKVGTWPKLALIISFLVGIALSSLFNAFIHALTSQSIVHCDHDEHGPHGSGHGHSHSHNIETSPHKSHSHRDLSERTPLLRSKSSSVLETMQFISILDLTDRTIRGKRSIGKCMGYSRVEDCVGLKEDNEIAAVVTDSTIIALPESLSSSSSAHNDQVQRLEDIPSLAQQFEPPEEEVAIEIIETLKPVGGNIHTYHDGRDNDDEIDYEEDKDHHHHVLTKYSHLFTIGLQTALAISVHKIPEGFLTFATTHHDTRVGFNVFVALAVHNFAEGFSIAFPLYLAFKKRWLALLIGATLGGLSQPLGGLIAWTLFKQKINEELANKVFGWLIGGTSGFMTVIGFQMYGTSIFYGKHQTVSLWWAILGIAVIGLSSSLV
jgi:zinc transporter, ZIP family